MNYLLKTSKIKILTTTTISIIIIIIILIIKTVTTTKITTICSKNQLIKLSFLCVLTKKKSNFYNNKLQNMDYSLLIN
jgi:hypothetical protein